MNPLTSSSLEECIQYMGEPQISVDTKEMSDEEIRKVKKELSETARRRGYRNLVWKTEADRLYAF